MISTALSQNSRPSFKGNTAPVIMLMSACSVQNIRLRAAAAADPPLPADLFTEGGGNAKKGFL